MHNGPDKIKYNKIELEKDSLVFELYYNPKISINVILTYIRDNRYIQARECVSIGHINMMGACEFLSSKIIHDCMSNLYNNCRNQYGLFFNLKNDKLLQFLQECDKDLLEEMKKITNN